MGRLLGPGPLAVGPGKIVNFVLNAVDGLGRTLEVGDRSEAAATWRQIPEASARAGAVVWPSACGGPVPHLVKPWACPLPFAHPHLSGVQALWRPTSQMGLLLLSRLSGSRWHGDRGQLPGSLSKQRRPHRLLSLEKCSSHFPPPSGSRHRPRTACLSRPFPALPPRTGWENQPLLLLSSHHLWPCPQRCWLPFQGKAEPLQGPGQILSHLLVGAEGTSRGTRLLSMQG